MTIRLFSEPKAQFVRDLKAHREAYALNDAEYADQILKVSLNTYKKCVQSESSVDLAFKRQTFVSILGNAGLDPRKYGLAITIPSQASKFGGYQKGDFAFLCGRFLLYRRSFLTARHITRGVLDIYQNDSQECLSFCEMQFYVAEGGARQELRYQGDIYINREKNLLSFPAYDQGQVRLTLMQLERLNDGGSVKLRGALLTFGSPKGYWQPTVSCVFADGPAKGRQEHARDCCKTIADDSEEYASLSNELARVEEHAAIITPMMWAKTELPSTLPSQSSRAWSNFQR